MKSSGKGVPKMSDSAKINGASARNKGKASPIAGTNKASGKSAKKISKVK